MPDALWNERFFNGRVLEGPAWHRKDWMKQNGIPQENRPYGAREIIRLMGDPQIERLPLKYVIQGQVQDSGWDTLVRCPTVDDKEYVQLAVVERAYDEINYQVAGDLWDDLGLPVDSLGFIHRGKAMFISGILPSFDIGREEIKSYLLLHNPLNGTEAASGHVTNVRVVCQNTLISGIAQAASTFRIRHTKGAAARLGRWMKDTYESAKVALELIQESYEVLAKSKVKEPQVRWLAETLYKLPNPPAPDKPRKISYSEALAAYQYRRDWVVAARSEVVDLYNGKMIGFNSNMAGTAWGAFNAVAQLETYRRGTSDSTSWNVVGGDRANTIRKAHGLLMAEVS